jgi:hypothetical protein
LLPLEAYPNQGVFGETIGKHGSTEEGVLRGVFYYREDNMKIIYKEADASWELYDLKEDPKELKNIVDTSPFTATMKEKLTPRISKWVSS